MILPLILLLLVVITNIILALLVFSNNPKSATNRLFSSLNIVLVVWLIINYLSIHPFFHAYSLILIRFTIFYAVLVSLLFYLLSVTIPKKTVQLSNKSLGIAVIVTIITMIITISPFAFTGIQFVNNSPQPIPGPGMLPFSVVSTLFSALAVHNLFSRIRKTTGIEREQLLYVAFGILSMLGAVILTVLIPVLLFNQNIYVGLLPLYTLFFLTPTTYAIIKHRLMDIRLIVAKTVSFTLLITLAALIYALTFANLTYFLSSESFRLGSTIISTIFSLIMVLSFQPIKRIIEKLTDRVFYRNHYNTNTLLHSLARIMAGTYELKLLGTQLLIELVTQMRLSKGFMILIENNKVKHIINSDGINTDNLINTGLITVFNTNRTLIFEDINDESDKQLMRTLNLSYVTILKSGDKKIGLLCLGTKLSGDIFTDDDIRVIETFASEAAVAIQNALAIEQIQEFNTTLQQEVDNATKDLQDANSRLKELDKLKDEFVSLASHELRTPMTAIKSYLWLFLQNKEIKLNEKQKQYIERAYQATDRLITLVNDMLNVSRIESGRMNILIKPFDLQNLISEIIDELKPAAEKQGVSILHNTNDLDIPKALADQNKIREVIINLIGNSIKFTPAGGKISIEVEKKENELITKVRDTGKGIKSEDIPKLFHKFQTVGNNYLTKINTQGTGLGLYLSKSIVEMNNGKIWAESEGEGKGAIFSFSLKTV